MERFSKDSRAQIEVRLALFSGNIIGEIERLKVVPLLLAQDPAVVRSLATGDYARTSQKLIEYRDEIGAAALRLYDTSGRVVGSTERVDLGKVHRSEPFFVNALRSNETVYVNTYDQVGRMTFYHARKVELNGTNLGVITVEVDLHRFEASWARFHDTVVLLDSTGHVILTTEPRWRGMSEADILEWEPDRNRFGWAVPSTEDLPPNAADVYLRGAAMMREDVRVPFQGWRLVAFSTYGEVREQVNGVLALEVMGFALLFAGLFFVTSRRAEIRSARLAREYASLRRLNTRLQREIAERERAERNLQVAEQSLAQSSKLAALGEMSAAVSHELNQPLAAMKTYLAGARLLLERARPEEAMASFTRINDLIDRMATITRQLKSFARKSGDETQNFDLRLAVTSAIDMMTPQMSQGDIRFSPSLPPYPVPVQANRIRVEQVIINLLRNAVDATKGKNPREIDVVLSAAERAVLSVRDNGPGIEDLESLFEPFYTTKAPGEGVGLGLAISSDIVKDMGGRLTARNSSADGAIFKVDLPLAKAQPDAAE